MKSLRHIAFGLVLVAPMGGYLGAYSTLSASAASQDRCLMTDTATFRVLHGAASANYHVRFTDGNPSHADRAATALHIAIVQTPGDADFILVDDVDHTAPCRAGSAATTIAVESTPVIAPADVVVALTTDDDAAYRVYVRSHRFTGRDGAAVFAVMLKRGQNEIEAGRIQQASRF
jgi:hypothetical protein